jgi:sulfite dehydrogenase (quinone) subunit SoeC
MAQPDDAPTVALGPEGRPDADLRARQLFSLPAVVIQTATATGYGLWMVLGTAVALGSYPDGRGDVLVPLFFGLVLVSLGLAATCLRLGFAREWHGWDPFRRMLPTTEGMVAMANYLPMLALAGLARGDNDFWATRLAGAALMICSLATLIYTARGLARDMPVPLASVANAQPLGRAVSAVFAGGLWFWLCVALQSETVVGPLNPWRLSMLAVGLVLGVIEGMRWRALRQLAEERGGSMFPASGTGVGTMLAWCFGIAVLSVGLPCMLLVSHPTGPLVAVAAGLAALSCVIGQCLEQRLYGRAWAQFAGR